MLHLVEEVTHKRAHAVCVHSHEMSGTGRKVPKGRVRRERKMSDGWGLGEDSRRRTPTGFSGVRKRSGIRGYAASQGEEGTRRLIFGDTKPSDRTRVTRAGHVRAVPAPRRGFWRGPSHAQGPGQEAPLIG